MKSQIGISTKETQAITDILSPLLADEFVLYLKTRNAHWNVEGPDFHAVHVYFEQLYTELETIIDEAAERIRKLGHYAPATFKEYLGLTHLSEKKISKNDSLSYMKELLMDHESVIMYLRGSLEKIGEKFEYDFGTEDYLTSLLEYHEKTAWMLRSHLK